MLVCILHLIIESYENTRGLGGILDFIPRRKILFSQNFRSISFVSAPDAEPKILSDFTIHDSKRSRWNFYFFSTLYFCYRKVFQKDNNKIKRSEMKVWYPWIVRVKRRDFGHVQTITLSVQPLNRPNTAFIPHIFFLFFLVHFTLCLQRNKSRRFKFFKWYCWQVGSSLFSWLFIILSSFMVYSSLLLNNRQKVNSSSRPRAEKCFNF